MSQLDQTPATTVSGVDPLFAGAADQLRRRGRAGVVGEQVDGCLDPAAALRVELAGLADC